MRRTTENLLAIAGILMLVLLFIAALSDARASGNDIYIDNSTHYYSEPESSVGGSYTGIDNDEFDKGMAISAAGDTCVFDYAPGWQGCVGGGFYESQSALNGSLVTRIDQIMIRSNVGCDTDWDNCAIGIGGSWHF